MHWGSHAGAVEAQDAVIADESVWMPHPGLENDSLQPTTTPTGLAQDSPRTAPSPESATATSTSAASPTATPPVTLTATPTPSPSPTPTRPTAPQRYRVEAGDTVSAIAARFGVSPDTILWANGLANPNSLYVGQTLVVLPVSGITHTVQVGDTLSGIADTYGVPVSTLLEANGITPDQPLQVGQTLVVPGARPRPTATPTPRATATPLPTATPVPPTPTRVPPTPTPAPPPPTATPSPAQRVPAAPGPTPTQPSKGNGQLAWPVAGTITQQYGENGHEGIDIATAMGTPVRAVADGRVINLQQLQYGYGWYLVIDHGNGMKSLYAHLSGFNVKLGDQVKKGQQIGAVGATGKATGPHLHLEIRVNDKLVNPLSYL